MTVPKTGSVGDARSPAPRRSRWRAQGPVVAAVALGGGTGAAARYAASLWWPTPTGQFPWTTFGVNAVGCAVIGVFMVVITEARAAHHLVRPFFGTGVLGGFTTFSTYAVDSRYLFADGRARLGLVYLAATPLVALTAVGLAAWTARRVLKWRRS
ncbi:MULTISPECIES: fluoride efflux transporter FluC [Streptomyces]|uniref:Fluoride-specific ion channel FluC n=1 Tax=Streptomyces lienomycini TaxID=284035 RepID=A0ABV9X6Y2_9ACTN|nr:CrcB family protein [Streptomyces lienomycini]